MRSDIISVHILINLLIITIFILQNFCRDIFQMVDSPRAHSANGFKSWSAAHTQGSNDDDQPGGATPIALTAPEAPLPKLAKRTGSIQ